MKKVTSFILCTYNSDVQQTVKNLHATGQVENVILISCNPETATPEGCQTLQAQTPFGTETMKAMADLANTEFTLLYTKETTLQLGMFALERMMQIANDSQADLVYADHYQTSADGKQSIAPVIDYQFGSLRDDFDFGSVLLFRTSALKDAAARMNARYQFAAISMICASN